MTTIQTSTKTAKPAPVKATAVKATPGGARLQKKLGVKGKEALRATVLADQAKAVAAVKAAPVKAEPKAAPKAAKPEKSAPADAAKKITLLAKENPHGEKTKDFAKWKLVAANPTVGAALNAGVDRGYLNYMLRRKLIEIA